MFNFFTFEDRMKKQIDTFIKDLKSNKKLNTFDEASTKQAVVLRLLGSKVTVVLRLGHF
jgi:hypothetical protein